MNIQEKIDQLEDLIDEMSKNCRTFEDEQLVEDWTTELFLLKRELEDKNNEESKLTELIEEEY